MARTREFDPKEALEKSMFVFWQKGYLNTSIDDIVEATGVSRYGLYGEFGNKRELFLACLDYYQSTAINGLFSIVEQPAASLHEIKFYFENIIDAYSQPQGKLGCLMCNSATEIAPHDLGVETKINSAMQRLTNGFKAALLNAHSHGELKAGTDPQSLADFLTGTLLGVSVLARSGAKSQMIKNSVEMALKQL